VGIGKQGRILLGRIAGAHGIRGEVLIKTFTAEPEGIAAYGALSDADGQRTFNIERARATPKGVVARVAGINDRDAAEALKGIELYVEHGRLPPPGDGEFYHADLIGLSAVDPSGTPVGEIIAVHNHGAGDLIEVRLAGSSRTELIPFTEATVPRIDMTARQAVMVMPASIEVHAPGDEEE
jgi:16S rRNA processing protein RimM